MLGGLLLVYRKGAALLRRVSLLRRPHKHIGLYYHTCLLPPQESQGLLSLDAKAILKHPVRDGSTSRWPLLSQWG